MAQNTSTRSARLIPLLIFVLAATGLLVAFNGCRRSGSYSQSSADATVRSLAEMVKDGNVSQIPSLFRVEDPKLQELLERLGPLFDRLHNLSETLQEKYPGEFEALVEKAAAAGSEKLAASGRTSSSPDQWQDRFTLLLADPFGSLDRAMDCVSTVYVDDNSFALTIDGQPAFGIGLLLREHEGKWYFQLPENIPGLNQRLPKSDAEWRILNAMLKSVTNGVEWTERRIAEEENVGRLDEIRAQLAIDVLPQLVVQWSLYEQANKARQEREEREQAQAAPQPPATDGSGN